VHLRRALLLFAIVLGLAAVATAVSCPREETTAPPAPTVATRTPAPAPTAVTFDADRARARRIDADQAATVYVRVPEAGQVSIDRLRMSDTAEPDTPAEFDIFGPPAGRYPILFQPAGSTEALEAGTLVVR
jgi:hypothetical protein